MRKLALPILILLVAWLGPAVAQTIGLISGATPTVGFTTGQCVSIASNGTVTGTSCGGAPSGAAGGSLTGTYPNPTIAANAPLATPVISTVAWASIPAAGTAGKMVRVSNFGTSGAILVDNGTRWRPLNGCTLLASLDTAVTGITNAETVAFQYQIPANVLQNKDRLRLRISSSKSGATDTATLRIRMGTAGTTADTLLYTGTLFAAANRATAIATDFRLETATTIQMLANSGSSAATMAYSAVANQVDAAAVTVTSAAANALFFSVLFNSSSTNDTITLLDAQLDLCATPN